MINRFCLRPSRSGVLLTMLTLTSLWVANPVAAVPEPEPNVLLILVDDLGIEHLDFYEFGNDHAETEFLTTEVQAGNWLVFKDAWSTPLCSSTRWSILTGRHGFETNIGTNVDTDDPQEELPDIEDGELLPRLLADNGGPNYATAIFGKWHVGSYPMDPPDTLGDDAPNVAGFDHAEVFHREHNQYDFDNIYVNYEKTVNGADSVRHCRTGDQDPLCEVEEDDIYMARDFVDWAIGDDNNGGWLLGQTEPWFIFLPHWAPHRPFKCPPDDAYDPNEPIPTCIPEDCEQPCTPTEDTDQFQLMIQALDHHIERVVTRVRRDFPNTIIILASDNGSMEDVNVPPTQEGRVKSTVFEGGVRIPLMVTEVVSDVPGRTPWLDLTETEVPEGDTVNLTDLYETILDLAGIPDPFAIDPGNPQPDDNLDYHSQSLLPYFSAVNKTGAGSRECNYTEIFSPNGPGSPTTHVRAIRDATHKYITVGLAAVPSTSGLYFLNDPLDLDSDPWELDNLLSDGIDASEEAIIGNLKFCASKYFPFCPLLEEGEECDAPYECCSGHCLETCQLPPL